VELDLDDLNERVVDATFLHLPPRRFNDGAALNYGERLMLQRWLNGTFAGLDDIRERLGVGVR
jgi:hypothetical protein